MACRSLCAALIFFAVACASCCQAQTSNHTFYAFCFWDAFARWRPAPHNFNVSDIPAELCDAVIYSHVTIDNNTGSVKLTEKELQLDPEAKAYSKSAMYNPIWMLPPHRAFREMSELKKRNPKLKLLLAIGGPHETIDHYWQFIPQMHLWRDMVISIAQWVKTYGFDGIVLDFFSGSRTAHDREWKWETAKLIDPFIWEIRQRFKQYLPNWHIILTLPAFDSSNHYLFDINRLSQQVNFFFVKSSDCLEFPQLARLNVSTTMDMSDYASRDDDKRDEWELLQEPLVTWLNHTQIDRIELMVKRGAERTRIVLEVPLSGRTYSVTGAGLGRRTLFAGPPGKYTKQQGFLSSFEVCDHLLSGWQQWRSSPDSCPYLKDNEEYVTYEDEESIRNKASMIIGRKFRGAVVRSVDLDDCNSKCTGKSNLVKMIRSSFDTASPDKDYPYNPPTASWWDEDIFKLMPTTAPPPKETTTKQPGVPTRTHNKEPASTMIPTTGQSVTSSVSVPASNDPRMVPSTTEKVPPAIRTSPPAIGEEVTATTAQLPSKSSTLAATEATTSSITAPASKDPGMVPSTPEKVPPAIKTTQTTIDEEVTVTPAQLPSKSSTLTATEAGTSFVTVPASKDPGIVPNTPEKASPAVNTSTPAIGEQVTVTTAQLPSRSLTLAATEAVTSSVMVPASKGPVMVPSTPENVPPAIKTTTTTMDEEVTVAPAQLPSKSSTLAATEAATSFFTVPASKDPGIVPNTTEKVSPAVKTSTPAIGEKLTVTTAQLSSISLALAATEEATSSVMVPASKDPGMVPSTTVKVPRAVKTTTPAIDEEVTVTPAQLPSKSSTLALTEAASSSVSVPSSNDPRMVPSTTEKMPPAVKTSTPAIGEEVTVTPAQLPPELSTLAATETATKKSIDEICREDNENALMPHESDCTKYYHCAHSKPHLQNCARGTVFDIERQICNWPAMTNRPECKERKENRRKRMAGRLTSL